MSNDKISTVIVLLNAAPAVDIVQSVQKAKRSENPLARQLAKAATSLFGDVALAFARPMDRKQEHILRLETEHPRLTKAALQFVPGASVLTSFTETRQPRGNSPKPPSSSGSVFAMLNDLSGTQLLDEIRKTERSEVEVVRRILDDRLGEVSLATTRPVDEAHAHCIRIDTNNPVRTKRVLHETPGVSFAILCPQ
ncbi:MAG: hypothetical protein M3N08_06710 [Pseudomonadota bacterium]|nr:hypothetical protein [Pseudomonadota bacterium]